MSTAIRMSYIIKSVAISGLIFLCSNEIVYSENLNISDSINIQSDVLSKISQGANIYSVPSGSFYKTDNIFSFRSPEGYFPSLINNFREQAAAPFELNQRQWFFTCGTIGITAALLSVDNDIDRWARVQKQKHEWINRYSPVITRFGGDWGIYSVIGTGMLSSVCGNEKGVQTSLLATQSMITSGVWVRIIKTLTGRERPMADYTFSKSKGGEWYGPFSMYDQDSANKKPVSAYDSFPSGHTATAFSIATVFAEQYRDIKVVPVLCYSTATLVGISRLTEHEHWASDVFVGGVLGYLCGNQVVNHYNKIHQSSSDSIPSRSNSKAELSFIQNGNQIGFLLKW
jgi:hypothetical protein